MPTIFHKVALIAASGGGVQAVPDAALEDWGSLSHFLDGLTPEQRCDAVYADWLLQLQSPAHPALLQIRNLLLGQGALAANYLAELAQNADDASDGLEAALTVDLWDDWLLVGNDGRKVTSMNLLGLCRFFVHAAGKIRELDATTIGKFGIGFKSGYRIASEVIVHSWDEAGAFTFRLPICREGEPDSVAEPARLLRVESELMAAGAGQQASVPPADLGYCTPEALTAIPEALEGPTASLRRSERGTVFAFHLREEKQAEVRSRVSGQVEQLYELCPLFLPNLRTVRFGPHERRMRVGQHDPKYDLVGRVREDRITLSTAAIGQPQSHSRFWRLTGEADGDLWQLALHADSQHRLRVDAEEDEHGLRLQDGAAYGFFPLNAASRAWPFRLHLHLNVPTNLARDDWNPDERAQVEKQLRLAVTGLCDWLVVRTELWHPKWQIQLLIKERPHQGQPWASLIWDALRLEVQRHRLLRTVWGGLVTADRARTVRIVDRPAAKAAWAGLYAVLPNMGDEFPLVDNGLGVDLGLAEFTDADLRAFFLRATSQVGADAGRQALVAALFTAEAAKPETLEAVSGTIPISCNDQTQPALWELLERPAGADLPDLWHETFANLRNWLWDTPHGLTSLCGSQSDRLPDLLIKVPAVAAASLIGSNLSVEIIPSGRVTEIEESAMEPAILQDPLLKRLLQNCEGRLSKCADPLSIRWLHGDRMVAELREVQFAVRDGRVLTHCVRQVFESRQFTEVLSLYRRSARGGAEFERFQEEWAAGSTPHQDLYEEHRKEIVATLLRTQVLDQGYGAEHVIRELLQNAESAYDSQPGQRPAVRDFEFSVVPAGTPTGWIGSASHSGQHFNQPLRDGSPRDDIRLIVSTPSAEAPPTDGWIGRFNRGFKAAGCE